MKRPRAVVAKAVGMLVLVAAATGCDDDLGKCDQAAAERVVYGPSNLVVTAGQALTHDSCGSGAFCHSERAQGANRMGVPANLDFDMIPNPMGWFSLHEHRAAAWNAVDEGAMPPRGKGASKVGALDWRFERNRARDSERLPSIYTAQGKEIFRNWLACDAPTVAAEHSVLPPIGSGGSGGGVAPPVDAGDDDSGSEPAVPDWAPIFDEIIKPTCATAACHDDRSRAGGLQMTDECDALSGLLASGPCNKVRLVPGDTDSFLLEKLQDEKPSCGSRMPILAPLPAIEIDRIERWIEAGAQSTHCEP